MSTVKASLKLIAFLLLSSIVVPLQSLVLLFHRGKASYIIPHLWQCGVCKIFGLKVEVKGTPHTGGQTIYVSNHMSYLDIPVIASVLKASFVAKADVQNWPVFGLLSKMQQTAFISRSRSDTGKEKNALANMMNEGKSLIIFPEGTSSDGTATLPFKSSLFSIAINKDKETEQQLTIQPITLTLLASDGQSPKEQKIRDTYAWHGDMTMAPHLWAFAKSKGARISIHFHEPHKAQNFKCRKELASICQSDVAQGMSSLANCA